MLHKLLDLETLEGLMMVDHLKDGVALLSVGLWSMFSGKLSLLFIHLWMKSISEGCGLSVSYFGT